MAYQKVYMNQIHSSSLLSQLSEMWRRDVLCDAVITTGTVNTKAHRLVLVAACPMLQSMDSASVGNKLEVKLSPDINKAAVISFLQYLYDGFMTLTEDNVRDIEKIARLLQVDSVTKCCNDFYKVLQSTVGQDFGTNQKFPFNTDCAEFKHIKTSDLQRLMQNCSEKRNLDAEEVSLRKKARIQRQSTNSLSKSSGEDSFQLIQTKQNTGNSHSDNSSVHKSVAVSVASRTEATDTNMDVVVVDDNMADSSQGLPSHQLGYSSSEQLTGSTTLSKSGKVSPSSFGTPKPSALHRPYSPSSNRPSSSNAMKSKGGHPSVFKSDLNYNSHKQPIKTQTKNSNAKSQNAWVISHPEKQSTSPGSSLTKTLEDQITIEPMSEEHDSDVSSGMFDSAGQGLSNEPSALERVDESNLDQKENISFAGNEDDNSGRHSPNLSIVKIEKVGESFDLPSGSKDDSYPYKEENEEENSDQEYGHYGDTSQTSFTADDHSTSWYTLNTFKDFLVQNDESPDFEMLPLEEIDDALYRFYQSGMISPDLLNSIPRQLTQHLKATPYCRIVNVETDSIFHTSNFALKAVCSITQPDDGRRKKPMSQDDLNKLYDSGTLSNDNPTGLQNKVWVELMIYIGGLAREDLRRLEKDNFVFEKDDGGHMYYRLDATCMTEAKKQIKVYEQPDNLNCPVRSLWLYLSKLNPQSEVFFQQAIKDAKFEDSVWYTHKPIGKNAHSMWLSTICKEAGITTEYRNQALYCRSAPFKLKMKKDVSK